MSDQLNLYSTDQLLHELCGRFEHVVFAGLKTGQGDGSQQQVRRKWVGNHATTTGLAFSIAHAIMRDHYEQAEDGRIDE